MTAQRPWWTPAYGQSVPSGVAYREWRNATDAKLTLRMPDGSEAFTIGRRGTIQIMCVDLLREPEVRAWIADLERAGLIARV